MHFYDSSKIAINASGSVGVRSSNSGSGARPIVSFEGFRVQSLGLSVHAFMRPDALDFTGEKTENYVHWLGKGDDGQQEWAFRFYPDEHCSDKTRINTGLMDSRYQNKYFLDLVKG